MGNTQNPVTERKSETDSASGKYDGIKRRSSSLYSKAYAASLVTLFEKLELTANDGNAHPGELTRSTFEDVFHGPLHIFGKLMFKKMANGHSNRECITREQFVKAGKDILKLFDESQQRKYYFKLFAGGKDHLNKEEALQMVNICYALTLSTSKIQYTKHERDDKVFESMVNSMFGLNEKLSFENFEPWMNRNCPHMFCGVHNWVYTILTGSKMPDELETAPFPQLDRFGSGSHEMTLGMLWALSATLPSTYTQEEKKEEKEEKNASGVNNPLLNAYHLLMQLARLARCQSWTLLYNSDDHGLSMNRFTHHSSSYHGPSVTLMSFEGRNIYCLAVDCGWTEGPNRFGKEKCMLIQVSPVYRVLQTGDSMVIWNELSRELPRGIQVGQTGKTTVLTLPHEFDRIQHYGVSCMLNRVEMWGCGPTSVREAQVKQKQWERKDVDKSRQRKLKMEHWNDSPDRQLLDWGGVKTSSTYQEMR